jgi:hypothetical protein
LGVAKGREKNQAAEKYSFHKIGFVMNVLVEK